MHRFVCTLCFALIPIAVAAEEPLKRLTLEALFENNELEIESLQNLMWLPDGENIIYWTSLGESKTLWRQNVKTGDRLQLADWAALMEDLAEQRPGFHKPSLKDVNSSASHRLTPVLSLP